MYKVHIITKKDLNIKLILYNEDYALSLVKDLWENDNISEVHYEVIKEGVKQ